MQPSTVLQHSIVADLVRRMYAAYQNKERSVIESLLSEDFTFTSPYDDRIDRATYFKRCWPNSALMRRIDVLSVIDDGREAFALYECELRSGAKFRNTERLLIDGGKVAQVEVYFGDPPSGISKQRYQRFLEFALPAWQEAHELQL